MIYVTILLGLVVVAILTIGLVICVSITLSSGNRFRECVISLWIKIMGEEWFDSCMGDFLFVLLFAFIVVMILFSATGGVLLYRATA